MTPLADIREADLGDGVRAASIDGEIDLSNAERVLRALLGALPADGSALLVDLTGTRYLDSSGVRVVYALRDGLHARGQALALVVPQGSVVRDVLEIAHVSSRVPVCATRDEALAAVAS